ncbi:MAG: T9SS type A sorting domain-containing protein, partial [Bacteroidales bacterium]|nr:T9SS type A sorting domain-containing protein [Bacteroidales bacterium]
ICGYTESFGEGENDIYVLKLDENGNEIWIKTYGGMAAEMGRKIIELSDGNYVILGNTGSFGAGNRDIYLLKTDQEGNVLWTQTYGTDGYQDAFSVKETSDGGFIIAGHSDIHETDLLEAYVIKTNFYGYLTWEGLYEGSDNFYDYAKDVVETPNGNFLVCGHTKIRETRKNQAFLFFVDQDGNEIWTEEFGDTGSDWANSICTTSDGNFVIAGHTNSYGFGKYDAWLFKIQNPLTSIQDNPNPQQTYLYQNVPNPVKNNTMIKINIIESMNDNLNIYNAQGKHIKSYNKLGNGSHTIFWDRTDNKSSKVAPGLYYLSLKVDGDVHIRKMIVID